MRAWTVCLAALAGTLFGGCGSGAPDTGGTGNPPEPLSAVINANPTEGDAPLAVNASGINSTGNVVLYEWDYDYDGVTFDVDATGANAAPVYGVFGQYVLALRVTDDKSVFDIATVTIAVNTAGNLMPTADLTAAPASGASPLVVTLDASGSFDSDGNIATYLWDFEYTGTFKEDARTLAPASSIQHTYYFPGTITAAVKVLDNAGGWGTATVTITVDDSIITFADANLEAAVRGAIGKPTGDIHASDVVNLVTLNAADRGIVDLGGLARCNNIANLNLGTNSISSVAELAAMTSLEWLYLYDNSVSDITALGNLKKLKGLSLRGNTIGSLVPLTACTLLTDLNVAQNNLNDIAALQTCASLAWLDISDNNVSDITPVVNLTGLRRISAGNPSGGSNSITDLTPLASKLPNLEELNLSANGVAVLTGIEGHAKLRILDLSLNNIADITPLAGLTALVDLNLAANPLASTAPLAGLAAMRYIDLSGCGIATLADLGAMTNLRGVYFPLNNVTDLSPLAAATQLRVLIAAGNPSLADLSPLAGLLELTWIVLANNAVTDVTALVTNCDAEGLSAYDIVDVRGCPLSPQALTTDIPYLESKGVVVLK